MKHVVRFKQSVIDSLLRDEVVDHVKLSEWLRRVTDLTDSRGTFMVSTERRHGQGDIRGSYYIDNPAMRHGMAEIIYVSKRNVIVIPCNQFLNNFK